DTELHADHADGAEGQPGGRPDRQRRRRLDGQGQAVPGGAVDGEAAAGGAQGPQGQPQPASAARLRGAAAPLLPARRVTRSRLAAGRGRALAAKWDLLKPDPGEVVRSYRRHSCRPGLLPAGMPAVQRITSLETWTRPTMSEQPVSDADVAAVQRCEKSYQ